MIQSLRKNTITILSTTFVISVLLASVFTQTTYAGGNPLPGVPHDTLVIHIQSLKDPDPTKDCSGGHSAHIGAQLEKGRVTAPLPEVQMKIIMVDWVDEDGIVDGINDDAHETKFIDCDTRWDQPGSEKLTLQIGDKNHRKDWITTQSWFIRNVGIPDQALYFKTPSGTFFDCAVVEDPDPTVVGDETIECTSDTIDLNDIELDSTCVKSVKKNGGTQGKTVFCDITNSFLVDVDTDLNGIFDCIDGFDETDVDLCGVHIFSLGCEDPNLETPENELAEECPLGSSLWTFDSKTQRPTIQMFVSHDGDSKVTKAKPGHVKKH